jgi:hypothetical protein
MSTLSPHGAFFAQHKDVDNTLNFARDIHEAQLRLKDMNPRLYDTDVHAGIVAFHLRTISRKIDALVIELHRRIRSRRPYIGTSKRTARLQNALREYNASLAGSDPWDISLDAAVKVLDLAFDCFEAIDNDIRLYEQSIGQSPRHQRLE